MSSLKELKNRENLISNFIRTNNALKTATLSKLNKYKQYMVISDEVLKVMPRYIFEGGFKGEFEIKTLNLVLGCDDGMCSSFYNMVRNYLRVCLKNTEEMMFFLGAKFLPLLSHVPNVICRKINLNDAGIFELNNEICNYIEKNSITTFIIHYMHKSKIHKERVIILRNIHDNLDIHDRFFVYSMISLSIGRSLYSENKERLLSLENANTNSQDMLKKIRLKFNRLRQEKITNSLNEIVSGIFV